MFCKTNNSTTEVIFIVNFTIGGFPLCGRSPKTPKTKKSRFLPEI